MNLLQFVPVKLTIFLVIGILIGYYLVANGWVALSISATGLLMLYMLHFRYKKTAGAAFGIFTMLTCVAMGLGSISIHHDLNYFNQIEAKKIKEPRLWKLSISEELKTTAYYHRYFANVSQIDNVKSSGRILCRIPLKYNPGKLSAGDQILVWGSVSEIEAARNPHQFNYKKYLSDKSVYLQIKVLPDNHIKLRNRNKSLRESGLKLREKIIEHLQNQPFGKDELAVIQAVLLGYRHDVDKTLSDNYKAAGAMHIMAISGLHIGVILMILNYILKPLILLPGGRILKLILSVLILWGFALLSGFSVSILRAVTMFSFLAYALYLNRPGSTYNILALSIFFILLVLDPLMLFQVGFQLSYAAVLSIVWLYPKLISLWHPENILLRRVWQLCCAGTSAQLGVLPLSLYYFHQFPTLFLISNLIIVPFLGLIIGAGLLIIILAVLDHVPVIMISIYNQMIQAMNSLVEWIAKQEAFLFTGIYFDHMCLVISCCIIISFVVMLEKFSSRSVVCFLCLILSLQFYNIYGLITSKWENQIVLLHTIGTTNLAFRHGSDLTVFTNHPEAVQRAVTDFKTGERIQQTTFDSLGHSYSINKLQWLILDDPALPMETLSKVDIWLLSNSPKINLDRYLRFYKPEKIIADGSNYRSFVNRWKRSCRKIQNSILQHRRVWCINATYSLIYLTPCINLLSTGLRIIDTKPIPIGAKVNIRKNTEREYCSPILSIIPPKVPADF